MILKPPPNDYLTPLSTQGVRWKNFYRSLDKATGNRYNAKCGFCLADVEGRPERLHNHVLSCSSWPIVEKTSYINEATKDSEKCINKKKRTREVVEIDPTPLSVQQSLLGWISKPLSPQRIDELHHLLLKAIIYGGLPFSVGDNIYFKQFIEALCSTYNVPSAEVLRGRILTEMYSKHLHKKLMYLPSFVDFTVCFDGWTDVSGNSIYAFMVLKEESEDVLDIIDLSDVRHTAIELKERLLSDLLINGVVVGNALACVTDSPTNMVKLRSDLQRVHPNVIPIRCVLHGFNLVAKDVAGFPYIVKVCKLNLKLVNYFTSSHFWRKELRKWQEEKKIPHFLSTFCETRWYSLSRVCLGVAAYEEGFRHCLELSKKSGYPPITNVEVRHTIMNRYHFVDNEGLVEALKPIVDVIGNLEKRTTTLADVLASFITLHWNAKGANYAIPGLQNHVLSAIGKRVTEFQDPIYFVALFLHPTCKKMAMSRKMTGDLIIKGALEIAKAWHFNKRDVILLFRELINYKNGDAPFDNLNESSTRSARDFWEKFSGSTALLRRFAMKVFAIVPHSAPCERLFSTLGLIKTKPRNRLEVKTLNMLAQIKCDLATDVYSKKKSRERATYAMVDEISMDDFEALLGEDLLDEAVEEVNFNDDHSVVTAMEEFFDFEAFERDQAKIASDTDVDKNIESSQQVEEDFSIDAIMEEFKQ